MGPLSPESDKASESAQTEVARSTGEAAGGFRPKPEQDALRESRALNQPLPDVEIPPGTKINWDLIRKVESRILNGYVPIDTDTGRPFTGSGATIGTGFDLGQWNTRDLNRLGITYKHELFGKLEPYLGMKGNSAAKFLKEHPLEITDEEVDWLDKALKADFVRGLNRLYARAQENSRKAQFTDLPPAAQTTVFSVAYKSGANGLDDIPGFKKAALSQDWNEAAAALERRANEPGYKFKNRRLEEALNLYQGLMGEIDP